MPLTTMRWRLTLVACCAATLLFALQSPEEPASRVGRQITTRSRNARLLAVNNAMQRTADEYVHDRLRSVLDSVARAEPVPPLESVPIDRRPLTGALSVIAIDTVGRSALPGVRQMAERELATLSARRVPVRIVVMQTPREAFPRLMYRNAGDSPFARYVQLPTTPDGVCTLLLTARLADREQLAATLAASDGVLGPCAFFVQFGLPGRLIRAHLDSIQWHTAAFARWTAEPDSVEPPRAPWTDLTRDGVRCLVRGDAACARAWRRTPGNAREETPPEFAVTGLPDGGLTGPLPWYGVHGDSYGMRQRLFFSDLAREVGPDRFAAFWRSASPVDSAFLQLVGTSDRAWTSRWLARSYERYTPSPAPSRAAVAWWVLLLVGSGASIWGVRARRAT